MESFMQTAHNQTHSDSTSPKSQDGECTTPATTEEFRVWWESQYDPAESHFIKGHAMNENIEYVEGTSLELNKIFWELEAQAMSEGADFTGK